MWLYLRLFLLGLRLIRRGKHELLLENLVLRQSAAWPKATRFWCPGCSRR